jgi:uncharacterized surface protein with fasciclin (FAS1) repeats
MMTSTATHPRRSIAVAGALVAAVLMLTGPRPAAATPASQSNIVQTAAAAGQFTTLISLAKKAGLAGTLSGPGPLTVFAPTDAAFKAVPKATLTALANNRAELRRVLLYHVLKGTATGNRVVKLRSAKTLAGPAVSIRVGGGSIFLNGSTRVVKADIAASNGVIHVINKVLLPPSR